MTAPKATGHTATNKGRGAQLAPRRPGGPRREHPQGRSCSPATACRPGVSKDLTREDSEHLAAVASGFHSLAKGVGRHFEAGNVRQTVVELDDAFLFVTAAGDGSCLAVLSDADSDVGLVAYEMTLLVKRVGVHLGAAPRTDLPQGG